MIGNEGTVSMMKYDVTKNVYDYWEIMRNHRIGMLSKIYHKIGHDLC